MDQELLQELIKYVVLGLAGVLLGVLSIAVRGLAQAGVDYLNMRLGADKFSLLKSVVTSVVRALEQSPVYRLLDGAKKKEQAILSITGFAEKYGISVTYEEIDRLIEEAVQVMNAELMKVVIPEEPELKG